MAKKRRSTYLDTDPSENVKERLQDAVKRQDDLRLVEFRGLRKEADLQISAIHHQIRDFKSFIKKINRAETKRINAIRAVDVGNVALANTAAETRATTLAKQVADTAIAANISLKSETDPIRQSIDDLRKSQWTIAGGTAEGREKIDTSRAKSANWGLWVGISAAVVFGVGGAFSSLLMFGLALYLGLRGIK